MSSLCYLILRRSVGGFGLSELRRLPAGPARLARLLKMQEADVNELPLDANAPAPVTEAHQAFIAAASWARQVAGQVELAEQAAAEAGKADVAAALKVAQAGGAGKLPEPTRMRKAAGAVEAALLGCEAAEKLVEEAHDNLIHAVKEAWPTWRAQLIHDADSARKAAVGALEKAVAAVASARSLYAGVGSLDLGVLERYPKCAEAVTAERRGGLAWYSSTCGPTPLVSVNMPDPRDKRATVRLDLSEAAEALLLAVAEPGDFTQAEWSPPSDAGHDLLRATPLDLSAPWVVAAVRHDWGTACAICRQPGADTVEEQTGRGLVMVHAKCQNKEPDAKAQRNAERLATMQAHGFPPSPNEASQLVPDGQRVQKDDGR